MKQSHNGAGQTAQYTTNQTEQMPKSIAIYYVNLRRANTEHDPAWTQHQMQSK